MEREQTYTHIDVEGNETVRTMPSEHELAAHREVVEPVGQPIRAYEDWEHWNISIEPSLARYLRSLAEDDDISEGVRIAARFHQEQFKQAR